ncbi:hypothetical protein EDD29_2863 [Actinocorallia herbida]|uniref:Uncharacterized protein n=1 Tax=Actinocorallia herbida TaxID=58109 RepID=A0A3N1CVJ8_9ACTN|nr:DUF6069 family protein [Actinocorallia herbida]ROO85320.1 hypothetical protein EDD29_2863 [Actinocorallia herbida]
MNTTSRRLLITVFAAPFAALALWALAVPGAGVSLDVAAHGGPRPVGPLAIASASIAAGLAGWALLALLERFVPRPRLTWTLTALTVLALSLLSPLSLPSTGTNTTLTLLHLAVAAVLIPALPRR